MYPHPLTRTLTTSCPNDGFYTITNFTIRLFWQQLVNSFSRSYGRGKFMLVNASYQPGDFFISTVSALCPNTTYEFSAWVLNVMQPFFPSIRPNLTFRIEKPDGTVLASFDSGDVPVSGSPTGCNMDFCSQPRLIVPRSSCVYVTMLRAARETIWRWMILRFVLAVQKLLQGYKTARGFN